MIYRGTRESHTSQMPWNPIGAILRLYWGCMGMMEKKMETTITGYLGGIWGYMLMKDTPSGTRGFFTSTELWV